MGETGSFTEALTDPVVLNAAAGVVLGGAGVALARAAGPATMAAVRSMGSGSLRTLGFAMRPAGTYLSQGVSTTMRARNLLSGSNYARQTFNTFFNPEGNHFGNLTGAGSHAGGVTVGDPDPDGGDFSASDVQDNFTATRNEVGAGLLGTREAGS